VVIGSIRDPFIIRQIDDWVARVYERVHARVADVYGEALSRDDYVFYIRVYGKTAPWTGFEPVKDIHTHELCLLFRSSRRQRRRSPPLSPPSPGTRPFICRSQMGRPDPPGWPVPITPAYLERGAVYRFCVNHVSSPTIPTRCSPSNTSMCIEKPIQSRRW